MKNLTTWLQDTFGKREKPARKRPQRPRFIPRVEELESRFAPATLTVNTGVDTNSPTTDTSLSLRDAIALVNNPLLLSSSSAQVKAQVDSSSNPLGTNDVIQFNASLSISLNASVNNGPLTVNASVGINTGLGTLPTIPVTISGNSTNSSTVFNIGMGVTVAMDDLTIENGTGTSVVGPTSSDAGGIFNNGTLNLNHCTISGNHAFDNGSGGGYGGGILNYSAGNLTIQNSTISSNGAQAGGGIFNAGILTLTESTISGNTAVDPGAGIDNYSGSLTLNNSTISGNTAGNGGGIYNKSGATATLQSSIIAKNARTGVTGTDLDGAFISTGYNLVGDDTGETGTTWQSSDQYGTFSSPIDPVLGPLQNNGGPTETMALLAGSPAIGTGLAPSAGMDQRGQLIGSSTPNTTPPDIGAYQSLFVRFSDNFAGTSGSLSPSWDDSVFGEFTLTGSNQAQPTTQDTTEGSGLTLATVVNSSFATSYTDVSVGVNVNLGTNTLAYDGVVARLTTGGPATNTTFYFGWIAVYHNVELGMIGLYENGRPIILSAATVSSRSGFLRMDVFQSSLKLYLNGNLITSTIDTQLPGAGAVGIEDALGTSKSTFSNFIVYTPSFSTTATFADSFTNGNNWTTSGFAISSGTATSTGTGSGSGADTDTATLKAAGASVSTTDIFATVTSLTGGAGLLAGWDASAGTGYEAILNSDRTTNIYVNLPGGSQLTYSSSAISASSTYNLEFLVTGDSLEFIINGQIALDVVDTNSLMSGSVGIASSSAGATFTYFFGYSL